MLLLRGVALFFGLLTVFSCSPLSFFGEDTDYSVLETRNYREKNLNCVGIRFPKGVIEASSLRAVVRCLNTHGDLEPLQRLFDRLDDGSLAPVVKAINNHFLQDKERLFEIQETVSHLDQVGILDVSLQRLGDLLAEDELISTGIALWKETVFQEDGPDFVFLKAIEKLAEVFTEGRFENFIDWALSISGSRVFEQIQVGFQKGSNTDLNLRVITDSMMDYFRSTQTGSGFDFYGETFRFLASGDLFGVSDLILGSSPEALRKRVPENSAVMSMLSANRAKIWGNLVLLNHSLKTPIPCFRGTSQIKDAMRLVVDEVLGFNTSLEARDYLLRGDVLTMAAIGDLCELPPEYEKHYRNITPLFETSVQHPVFRILKSLNQQNPKLVDYMVGMFSDLNFRSTFPLMRELDRLQLWSDLFLFLQLPSAQDRQELIEFFQYLVRPWEDLGGRSIEQVFSRALSRASNDQFFRFIVALRNCVNYSEPFLYPALRQLRSAFYVNNVRPFISLVQEILRTYSDQVDFLQFLFKVAEFPEFRASLGQVAKLADEGKLRKILYSTIAIFRKAALDGKKEIRITKEPLFVPKRMHDLVSGDLASFEVEFEAEDYQDCSKVLLRVGIFDLKHPRYQEQMDAFFACLNQGQRNTGVENSYRFLNSHKDRDGLSFFEKLVTHTTHLYQGLSNDAVGALTRSWIQAMDSGRFMSALRGIPIWIRPLDGEPAAIRPLLKVAPRLMDREADFDRIQDWAASVLRRLDLPFGLRFAERIREAVDPDEGESPFEPFFEADTIELDAARLSRWVHNWECKRGVAKRKRVRQLIEDYVHGLDSWQLNRGRARRAWSRRELRKGLRPFLVKLSDPTASVADKPLTEAVLRLLQYFSLREGEEPNQDRHFTPGYLKSWLHTRSTDYRPILYFYPGESVPRVRLANGLDMLELIILNGDFKYVLPDNYSIKYTSLIGEAWGDEPREIWPDLIQEKYPPGGPKPPTLAEVIDEILTEQDRFERTLGHPPIPTCSQIPHPYPDPDDTYVRRSALVGKFAPGFLREKIFNLRQMIPFLKAHLPGSGTIYDGGLKVLRDLFFELKYSTPLHRRGNVEVYTNNLSSAIFVSKIGLLRQIGRKLRSIPITDHALSELFRGLTEATRLPETRILVERLVRGEKGLDLAWKLFDSVFDIMDGSKRELYFKQFLFYFVAGVPGYGEAVGLGPDHFMKKITTLATRLLDDHQILDDIEGVEAMADRTLSLATRAVFEEKQSFRGKVVLLDVLSSGIEDPSLASGALSLYRVVADDPELKDLWETWQSRRDRVMEHSDYEVAAEEWRAVGKALWLGWVGKGEAWEYEFVDQLRGFLADRFEDRSVNDWLYLMANKPDEFYRVLSTVSQTIENDDLPEFFRFARKAIAH